MNDKKMLEILWDAYHAVGQAKVELSLTSLSHLSKDLLGMQYEILDEIKLLDGMGEVKK